MHSEINKDETRSSLTALMKRLTIRLSYQATIASRLLVLLGVVLLSLTSLLFTTPALGEEQPFVAVIFPDIGEPYRGIFTKIIEGIEDKLGVVVPNYPVQNNTNVNALRLQLQAQNIKVIIALGRQGMNTGVALDNGMLLAVGGLLTLPEHEARAQPVISLSPDPALLFDRIKALKPMTRRVFVVYDPNFNGWLLKLAKESARDRGLELVAYEAQDLRSAVRHYQTIFSTADSRKDALWLPHDPTTVEENSVLPLVLQETWNKNLAVFSSNFSHVRRGVLFSLYPDNFALGRSLGDLALGMLATGEYGARGMLPLRDVLVAVNLRTAKHLGLDLRLERKSFDTVFPEP